MPQVDDVAGRVTFTIVYYGPGLAGRTTNVRYIVDWMNPTDLYPTAPGKKFGEFYCDDELGALWVAFLPRSLGRLPNGKHAGFRLVVPTSNLFRDPRRRASLKDVDGLVFVADSQKARFEANIESLEELKANLQWHGVDLRDVPRVLQLNKRDMPEVVSVAELVRELRVGDEPVFEAVAATGQGVFECIKELARQVLHQYHHKTPVTPRSRKYPS